MGPIDLGLGPIGLGLGPDGLGLGDGKWTMKHEVQLHKMPDQTWKIWDMVVLLVFTKLPCNFPVLGDDHQPNNMGLKTHYKDSLSRMGWPSPT